MTYTIIVTKSIQKDLDNLPNDIKTSYSKDVDALLIEISNDAIAYSLELICPKICPNGLTQQDPANPTSTIYCPLPSGYQN